MKHFRLLALALMSTMALSVFADASAICAGRIGDKGGNNEAFLRWETNDAGDIVITIFGDEGTFFRGGTAISDAGKLDASFTIDDGATTFTSVFERQYTNGSNTYTLKLKNGATAPAVGTVIHYHPSGNITWMTAEDNNAYKKHNFDYLYGSTCEGAFAVPQNVAVAADGTVTFDAVDGADDYMYQIVFGGDVVAAGYITSGAKLTRPLLAGGDYGVQVCARSTAAGFSDWSPAAVWALEAATVEVGSSEYCSSPIGSGNSLAYQTWETDAQGNVNITITGDGAAWRTASAFKGGISSFKVGDAPASLWFDVVASNGSDLFRLQLKDGKTLTPGEQIKFSGTLQWITTLNGDAYVQNQNYTYTYGATCGGLAKPTITSISADSVITITGDAEAYKVSIYYNGDLYFYAEGVHSGDKLNFPAITASTYAVTVIGTADGALDSEESDPYNWALAGRTVELGNSEYCSETYVTDYYGDKEPSRMYLTWETVNNDVVISIVGANGDPGTSFRGNDALGLTNFLVNGAPAKNFFNVVSSDGATEYRLQLKDGKSLPFGQVIYYKGTLCWRTTGQGNSFIENKVLNYTYGTTCLSLSKPVINGISEDKVIDIAEGSGAEDYGLKVYLGENLVYASTIHSGEIIGFVPRVSATYQVTVTARAAGMSDSEESDPYNWVLTAVPFEPVPSSICSSTIGEDESAAQMSWNTASNGDIYIEIVGDEGTSWRTDVALTPSGFTVGPVPATVYFDMLGENGNTLFRLQKKEGALIGAGTEMTYSGNLQWRTSLNGNAYMLGTVYTYVYGTVCEDWEDPTVDPGQTVGLGDINAQHNTQKVLVNGHLYIYVDGHMFNANGQLVK